MRSPEIEVRKEGAHREDAKRGKDQQIFADAAMIDFIMAVVTSLLVVLVRGRIIAHRANLRIFSLAVQTSSCISIIELMPTFKTNTTAERGISRQGQQSANTNRCSRRDWL